MEGKPIVKVYAASNGFIVEDLSGGEGAEYWAFTTSGELSKWLKIHLDYHEDFEDSSEL